MTKLPISFRAVTSAVAVLVLLVAVSGRAHAADATVSEASSRTASVARLNEEGLALYKEHDYRRATERFLQAYALEPDPNLLFNTARCYEAMGDREGAIEKYESFISKADADPQGKRRAADAVRALRQARQEPKLPGSLPALNAPSGLRRAGMVPLTEPAAAPSSISLETDGLQLQAPGPERAKSSILTAPTVVLASGVLVAAVGAITYALGSADHNKVTGSSGFGTPGQVNLMTESQARQLVDSGDTKKLVGGIALGVGGALVATAAVLYVSGRHTGAASREGGPLVVGLSPSSGGGRVFFQRTF